MRLLALLLVLIAAPLTGGRVHAHAQLVSSEPAADSVVAEPPAAAVLTFSEPVTGLATRWFPSGGGDAVEVAVESNGPDLRVPLPDGLGTGTHVLSWRIASADGHPVSGSLIFSIGITSAAPTDISSRATARSAALARGTLTFALVLGVGGAVFARLIDCGAGPAPRSRRLALWSALATPAASGFALGFHGLDMLGAPAASLATVAPWATALASPFSATAAAAALAGIAAAWALRSGGAPAAALAWALAAASFALFGHAATAEPRWLTSPSVAIHGAAFVFWVGALPGIAERAAQKDAGLAATLHRFSALALPFVAALLATGIVLAVVQITRPAALIDTAYGRLLLAKLALVALLLLLAALNHLRLTPGIARGAASDAERLRRSVAAEIGLAILILALANGFRLTPPPRAMAAVSPAEAIARFHGPSVMADLVLTPGRPGPNHAEITIAGTGATPLDPLEVSLALSDPARGVEPIRVAASRDGDAWRAGLIHLPHGGDWTVTLDVLISDFAKETLQTTTTLTEPR